MSRIIELKWNCGECDTKGILGRHKRCPACGSPREKGEMQMDGLGADDYDASGYNKAETVTDPKLLDLFSAGADWFCSHCTSGNIGDGDKCSSCGAPRYGTAEEDHPDFAGDHKKVDTTDDPWEDGYEPEEWNPEPDPPPPRRERVADTWARIQQEAEEDPVDDWREKRRKEQDRQKMFLFGGLGIALTLLIGFGIWAMQTHETTGTVSQMEWQQSTIRQHWTQYTVRKWRDETTQRREVKPTNGSGERAGMTLIGGCREEHHHDEQYQCGTKQESYDCSYSESYQDTCTRSESYACGETCRDNGNGSATCSTKYCSRDVSYSCTKTRRVPKTCERTVPKYCDRPIYETKCDYQTQEWRTVETVPASGRGMDTRWPSVDMGPEDRLRYAADYSVSISYRDRGKDQSYTLKPGDTTWLGMTQMLTESQATAAERAYHEWEMGEDVVLTINNLGGVRGVDHKLPAEKL